MIKKHKPRILIFSLAYLPFIGGAELALKEITKRLSEYEFDMITLRLDSRLPVFEKIGNINVYRIGFSKYAPSAESLLSFPMYAVKIFYPVLAALRARALYKKRHYDAIWAMMAYAGFATVLFRWFTRIPYVLTLQEGDTVSHMTKRLRIRFVMPIFKKVFSTPNIIQTISHYLADYARDMGYRGKIEVIPNGVDIKKFQPKEEKKKENLSADRQERKNGGKTVLITVSRLVTKNAVDDIVRALVLLEDNVLLRVIGIGHEEERLKLLAKDLNVENRVEFVGEVSHDILPTYLHEADIFIRPSRSEGMGSAFVEAIAAGLPVIATPVGGIVDFLKDGETGLFCKVNNPESIAEQVRRLASDEALRNRIISNARAMVEEKYDWDIITRDMQEKIFTYVFKRGDTHGY